MITFSTWYKKNMRSMNQFFEVLRLPVEEGYTTFEKDLKKFSMLHGEKLQEMLDVETASLRISGEQHQGTVVFKNVSARYENSEQSVLKNLNFEVKARQKIGVVGRTGSGKSSLIKLFWRYLDITEGQILIDGSDITKYDLKKLRSDLTIITQDVVILDGSLSDSIDPSRKYLQREEDKKRMMGILEELGFTNADFVKNGLDMKVNEGGSNLSQGEKQLVCFARALCKKNRIVLFDEATASIDIKTEERFQTIMEREFAESTIFIIAHRIQTIKKCDKVMVLDQGSIVEFDSYQNLLRAKEDGSGYF